MHPALAQDLRANAVGAQVHAAAFRRLRRAGCAFKLGQQLSSAFAAIEKHRHTFAFDGHVRQVSGEVGHVGDLRLFLMAALMLADELHEARITLQNGGSMPAAPASGTADAGVAEALNAVAARLEKIALGL